MTPNERTEPDVDEPWPWPHGDHNAMFYAIHRMGYTDDKLREAFMSGWSARHKYDFDLETIAEEREARESGDTR